MTDQEIRDKVNVIVYAYAKGVKIKPEDADTINAGVDLIVNFLQNINTIASK